MAEGGNRKSSVKPVPPPKPTGTTLSIPKSGLKKSIESPVRVSFEGQSTSSRGAVTDVKNVKGIVSENDNECHPSVSSPRVPKILSKPPLLPKPHLSNFQSRKTDWTAKIDSTSEVPHSLSSNISKNHHKPSKLIIPPQKIECENKDTDIGETKAPVAKLDEFDHGDKVSPVRPPRSPKHKNLLGGPFVLEVPRRQQLFLQLQNSCSKSASLGRGVGLPTELKIKTSSLGRNQVKDMAQVLENSGSLHTDCANRSPVRPPRRRNKSITQSPEVISPSHLDVGFQFDNVQSNFPVYAQVNYSSKKNRRSKEDPSTSETQPNEENKSAICDEANLDIVESGSCEIECVEGNDIEADKLIEMPKTLCNEHSVATEGCESETKEEVDSDYTYFSFVSNKVNLKISSADIVIGSESEINDTISSSHHSLVDKSDGNNPKESVESEMCNEACADCLPVQILEESCDSVSSSKLEWQSVRSSFNSSDSDVALEAGIVQSNLEIATEKQTVSDQNVAKSSETILKNCSGTETSELNLVISAQSKKCCIHTNAFCNCETDSSNLSGISGVSEIKLESPLSERRKNYKRLTSSLPTRKACKKQPKDPRRQSWTGYKDSWHYGEWKSSWLDEGDSSSGNMGDLDSSDNAVKQSSGEEVDSKMKSEQSVGRRLNLWLSSFGKSGKKSRSTKRHSHFYCERQTSDTSDVVSKDNVDITVQHSPSLQKSDSHSPQVSSPCSFFSAPSTPQLPCDLNDKVVSEESIVSDLQSDSDGEAGESNYEERNKSCTDSMRNEKKAFYIANELMTSEQVFTDALKLLNINFRQAIQKASSHGNPVIPRAEFDRILNSLPQLQQLNEDLLCDLVERIQNWSSVQKIADVIVKKGPFLKLYTSYIQNFDAQCNYFDECCQKYPKFAKAVKEFEASPVCQKLSVKHYMLKPVQRIPQYRLLLADYARHQDPSSPDYKDTKEALKIVCEVADHANKSIELGDHLSVLLQLQSQLGNYEIIKPGRKLLKDGELHKLSRKERQPRYFILLNDCLLYTSYYGSGPSSGLKVNSEMSLGGMKVTIPQAEDYHNEFSIITSTRSFTLSARSSVERQQWVEALQKAIQEYTSRQLSFQFQKLNVSRPEGSSEPFKLGKEAPIWIQDGRVTKCQLCVAEFTVTFRRHHCRACGKVVCGICSAFRAPLQYMKFQSDRVCEDCFNTLLREFDTPSNKIAEVIKVELGLRKCDKNTLGNVRAHFKRLGPSSGKKSKKHIPQRLLEACL
ncbi:Uncharacterized protein GBIM_04120 [Gryllus bimaculatus]|nr:Uncharacterized protein GBIM_04120 [Gryllus bimaculatus]